MDSKIKEFSGQKTEHLATCTNIQDANQLINEGWEVIDTTTFPSQTKLGQLGFMTIFVLKKGNK